MSLTETLLRNRIRRILNEIHPDPGGGYSGSGESTYRQPMILPHRDAQKLINFVDNNPGEIGGELELALSSSKHDPIPLIRMLRFIVGSPKMKGFDDEYWAEIISKETGGRYTKPERDPYGLREGVTLDEAYALALDYVNRWLEDNAGVVDRIVAQTGTPVKTDPRSFIMTRRTLKTLGMFIEGAEDVSGEEIELALLRWHTTNRGMWFVTTMGEEQIDAMRGGS